MMASSGPAVHIAFYAPLKSPNHPNPSGDRKIAQLFMAALQQAGFALELASSLRSFDKTGSDLRQRRLIAIAEREAERILSRWQRSGFKPQAWFCYHLYYKAPDLLGPIICQRLSIPYIVAEASWAAKRCEGAWARYHQWVDKALTMADKVVCINPVDAIALTHYFAGRAVSPIVKMATFIDSPSADGSMLTRQQVAQRYRLDTHQPWLVCVAMMRSGDKFSSYQYLSEVIHNTAQRYQLLVIGDGEKSDEVRTLFAQENNVRFSGALQSDQIRQVLAHSDILIWPAVNEALGMVFLEAQQAGVAVIAGDQGGVNSVVSKDSGVLIPLEQREKMSEVIDALLVDRQRLRQMQRSAKHYIEQQHSLGNAANFLTSVLVQSIK